MTEPATAPPPASVQKRLLIGAGIVLVLFVGYLLKSVLVPLFLAFLIAYALDPLVDRFERLHVPRAAAAILLMTVLITGTVMAVAYAVPYLFDEFRLAGDQLPGQLKALKDRADPWVWEVFHTNLPHTWSELGGKLTDELKAQTPNLLRGSIAALFGTLNLLLVVIGALIVPVFAVYLLIDFDRNVEQMKRLVPRRLAPRVFSIAAEIHTTLGGYVRGQLLACIILSTLYASGLSIVGLRLAIAIGIITGMLAFVPYIGFGTGFLMAVTMALLDWQGINHVLGTIGVMAGVQILDAMIITPRVVGGSVGLKPLPVLLTMMAAGALFGFIGVLLAVPLGAVVRILLRRARGAYLESEFYKREPGA